MPKILLLVQYDGTFFYGYQRQINARSVQEDLEKALSTCLRQEIAIEAAGRTDTGVHAKGMTVSFTLPYPIENFHKLLRSVNALSGEGLAVISGKNMPDDFHAQFSCTGREYEYWFLNTQFPRPLYQKRAYWIRKPLNFTRIRKELELLVGEYDFSSLTKTASLQFKKTPMRKIFATGLYAVSEVEGLYKIRIYGKSFLHNMIRIIVGTIFDLASGKLQADSILQIIQEKDRRVAGKTLPPDGLYFLKAYYANHPEVDELYSIL
ncbi:MAG: tRNA pseudouridine(38-40) synthase TruA [Spirochaetota bacterium]